MSTKRNRVLSAIDDTTNDDDVADSYCPDTTSITTCTTTQSTGISWLYRLPVAVLHHVFGFLDFATWTNLLDTSRRICTEIEQTIAHMLSYVITDNPDSRRPVQQIQFELLCILRTMRFTRRLRGLYLSPLNYCNISRLPDHHFFMIRFLKCIEDVITTNIKTLEFIEVPATLCTYKVNNLILTNGANLKAIPESIMMEHLSSSMSSTSSLLSPTTLHFTQLEKLDLHSYPAQSNLKLFRRNMDVWSGTLTKLSMNEIDTLHFLEYSQQQWYMSSLQSLDLSIQVGRVVPARFPGISAVGIDTIEGRFFDDLFNLTEKRFPALRKLSIVAKNDAIINIRSTAATNSAWREKRYIAPNIAQYIAPNITELSLALHSVDWIPYFNLTNLRSLLVRVLTVSDLEFILQQSPNLTILGSDTIIEDKPIPSVQKETPVVHTVDMNVAAVALVVANGDVHVPAVESVRNNGDSKDDNIINIVSKVREFGTYSKPSARLWKLIQRLSPSLHQLHGGSTPHIQSIAYTFTNLRELVNNAPDNVDADYENTCQSSMLSQSSVCVLPQMICLQLRMTCIPSDLTMLVMPNIRALKLYSHSDIAQGEDVASSWVNVFRPCQQSLQRLVLQAPLTIMNDSDMNGIKFTSLHTLQMELYNARTTRLFLSACPALTDVDFQFPSYAVAEACLPVVISTLPATCRFISIEDYVTTTVEIDGVISMLCRLTLLESMTGIWETVDDSIMSVLLNSPMLMDVHSPYMDDLRYKQANKTLSTTTLSG